MSVVVLVTALVVGLAVGWPLARAARRARRLAEWAESERAWAAFAARLTTDEVHPIEEEPWGARAARAWEMGAEFYCACGRRAVTYRGEPPPTCEGVSCIGAEHPLRVMHPAGEP